MDKADLNAALVVVMAKSSAGLKTDSIRSFCKTQLALQFPCGITVYFGVSKY
jgi:hypothetical protein